MLFVNAGTTTPTMLIDRIGGIVNDIDGLAADGETESILLYAPSLYAVDQPTRLVQQNSFGSVQISNNGLFSSGGLFTDPLHRAFFQYKNTNTFNFRCQKLRTPESIGLSDQVYTFVFDECRLDDMVYPQLIVLQGIDTDSDGVPDLKDVDSDNDGIYDCVESGPSAAHTNGTLNGGITTAGIPLDADPDQNRVINYTPLNSDGGAQLNSADLDSDGDGCFDVYEAGFTDPDEDGQLGNDPVTVNGNGQVTSGTDGYTVPQDDDGNGIPDIFEFGTLTVSCPANLTRPTTAGACQANVSVPAPSVWFNCAPYVLVNDYTNTANASGTYPLGTTTVTFTVTDTTGGNDQCSFTVTVIDTQAPVLTCPANITVNAAAGTCGAPVTYATPIGTDNCSCATTTMTSGLPSGSIFPVGTTLVTYTTTDAAGLITTCSFNVVVIDNQAPVITCPANITVNNDAGVCGAAVTYTTPVGTDNCPGSSTTRTAGLASGSTFPVGTTTVTHLVTDGAGLTASCSFTVTVIDNQAPVITCPANITVNNTVGTCGAVVTYATPVGTDNCAGSTTTRIAGLASGSTFPVGTTTVTHRVTDGAGLTASCSFTVTV
ncbi:MAG: HYR domain-containing protein, partial [Flavobacteriales bacterium]